MTHVRVVAWGLAREGRVGVEQIRAARAVTTSPYAIKFTADSAAHEEKMKEWYKTPLGKDYLSLKKKKSMPGGGRDGGGGGLCMISHSICASTRVSSNSSLAT